jgi:hypothetical protein
VTAELGYAEGVQAQVEVAPLQRVAAETVQVQTRRPGDQNALVPAMLVEQALQVVAPTPKLVDLVEEPEITRRQLVAQDRPPVGPDVVVELTGGAR